MTSHPFHNIEADAELDRFSKSSNYVIMVIETSDYLHRLEANQFNLFTQKMHNGITNSVNKLKGAILKHNDNIYLVAFEYATNAILCALKIQSNFKYITPKFDTSLRQLNIGIDAIDKPEPIQPIRLATRMCEVVKEQIVISSRVKTLYNSENKNAQIDKAHIKVLKFKDEKFLDQLMDYMEQVWNDLNFNSGALSKAFNYSKSQVYRKMISLTGKSPTKFIRDFRLNRALNLIHKHTGNISDISLQSGFESPNYFSKCFKERFNILPSKYIQQHIF